MKIIILLLVFSIALIPVLLIADGGLISISPDARIFEPNQNALIAWDGKEEILVLSTDLSASKPIKAIEVIPFPSEPTVKKADIKSFERATEIMNDYMTIIRTMFSPLSGGGGGALGTVSDGTPACKVTFHEKIGLHNINVMHVNDVAGFVKCVEDYLKILGQDTPKIPEPIKKAINNYLKDEYKWFVFDIIELGTEIKTRDAIQYQFNSKKLFYPMRISRAQEGDTKINLIVMTPQLLTRCYGIPRKKIRMSHPILSLPSSDLKNISDDISVFFNNKSGIKLGIWEISGMFSNFDKDVIAD